MKFEKMKILWETHYKTEMENIFMKIKINNFQRKLFKSKGNQSRETETNANMPLKSPVHKIIRRLENWRKSDYIEMYSISKCISGD